MTKLINALSMTSYLYRFQYYISDLDATQNTYEYVRGKILYIQNTNQFFFVTLKTNLNLHILHLKYDCF